EYLIDARNAQGTWRYTPKGPVSDSSVTAWALSTLLAAREVAIPVSPDIFEDVFTWLNEVTDQNTGLTGYITKGTVAIRSGEKIDPTDFHPTTTAARVYNLINYDPSIKENPIIKTSMTLVIKDLPVWDETTPGKIDFYYWFWGARAMFAYDGPKGPEWKKWKELIKNILLTDQAQRWRVSERWTDEAGKSYSMAINILTLQTLLQK
ncbi:MAG: hypothetical protein KAI63_08330, partial [Planctomycetes bacterium]|nr:hypothetical protein [Planctomycetota bacterium]